ncbi:MAG: site-specific DNA-methyltransferase [Planctomycetes bacterium]|nr:site-specific DNA-methyltransferase [Planctomycetota bacterium]
MARARTENGAKVEGLKHKDKRMNIPTEELRDFVEREEAAPQTMLYPRDPSLDPQLVWKGKDEQDGGDLSVPIVPIYIQEKIHPQAIVEDIGARARGERAQAQASLFADFNGLEFEQLIEFYQHEQNWANRLILGDSLHVMTSLAEKEGLKGKVQMIYIDPPYGIKFGSNWQVSTRKRDVKDGKAEDLTRQPEQIRAFRDTWKLGIHSYLAYLRDRLVVARELLTETGSIFVQIGDENVHLVRCLLDEVFGTENFVVSMIVKKKSSTTPTDPVNDYILWFARNRDTLKARGLARQRRDPEGDPKFNTLISREGGHRRIKNLTEKEIEARLSRGWRWARVNYPLVSQDPSELRSADYVYHERAFKCGENRHWTYDPGVQMKRLEIAERIFDGGGESLGGVVFWDDWPFAAVSNVWDDVHGESEPIYVVQTSWRVVERCLLMTTDPGDLAWIPTRSS